MNETLVLALRVTVSLALVLGLLWFLARRMGAGKAATRQLPITVLGRRNLGRRSGISVVDVAGRTLVLGVSDSEVRLLTELESGPFQLEDDGEVTPGPASTMPSRMSTPPSAFGGSVLSPSTWRTSWEVLRDRIAR